MRLEQEKHTMADQTPERGIEDESEEVEPEPPPAAVRRKVSFADAFGLDLVSVKEFDNRDSSAPDDLVTLLGAECKVGEEFYLSCLFNPPASDHDLQMRLQEQKLELESIELLPGSTTIRGIIRVLNLCFHKAVYVHATLDGWQSRFDLLAEYVPGSSDGETDRFSFRLTLTPPLEAEGTRVEFCLLYESAVGSFWANNRGMNYVVFCHRRRRTDVKEKEREEEREKLLEENNHREIRSCLKTISKKICTEETPTETRGEISDQVTERHGNNKEGVSDKEAKMTSPKSLQDCCRPLVDRRRKRRAARLARVRDYFSQKEMEPQIVDIGNGTRDCSVSTPRLSIPNKDNQQGHGMDTLPIIMHHEIPSLSLDWGGNTSPARAEPHDVCNGINVANETDEENTKSACEAWEDFLSGTDTRAQDDAHDQECISNLSKSQLEGEAFSNVHKGGDKETSRSVTGCEGSVDASAGGILELHPTPRGIGPSEGQDLDYQLQEEPRVTLTTRADHECEPEIGPEASGDSKAIVPSPGEEAPSAPDTTTQNSKGGDGISPEEFTGRSKIKENTRDTLTFTGIRDQPLTDGRTEGSAEKEDLNEASGRKDETFDCMRSWRQSLSVSESDVFTSDTKDNSGLQKDEERRFEPVPDAEDELPTLPTIHLSLMGGNRRILSWWGDGWSLGHVTRALVYSVVLLVIFVTAYLCDLPTCLAVYLFSLCWWYSQGVKQHLDGVIDVD